MGSNGLVNVKSRLVSAAGAAVLSFTAFRPALPSPLMYSVVSQSWLGCAMIMAYCAGNLGEGGRPQQHI